MTTVVYWIKSVIAPRHAELGSASILPVALGFFVAPWTLKQVQGDEVRQVQGDEMGYVSL
jgi:hypothetical protein